MRRRALLGGLGALAASPAWADCGEDERRRLLKLGNLLIPEAQACGGGSVVGPTATSAFLTANFTSAFNYPNGTGQQNVSPFCYGSMSSSWSDFIGQSGDWFGNDAVMRQFGQINPGLVIFKMSPAMFNLPNFTLNTSNITNLANNIYKWFPTGVGGVVFDLPGFSLANWPGLTSRPTTTQYAQMHLDAATFLFNHTMSNGNKFPLIGMGGEDESGMDTVTMQGYYNAFIPKVKSVSSNLLIFGPTNPTPDPKDFATSGSGVPGLDVFCGNGFTNVQGNADTMDGVNTSWPANETAWTNVTGNNLKYMGFSSAGSDFDCTGGQLKSYPEAMMHCKEMINNLNVARVGTLNSWWGGLDDCGLMDYPTSGAPHLGSGLIYPLGYWYAQGVRKLTGPRWQVPINSSGVWTVAVTPAAGRFGLLVFNVGNGAQNSKLVALSHWPVNTTGNGTANVWQMTSAQNGPGKDGASSTIPVVNGVTTTNAAWPNGLSFPDPSITIISI